MTRALVIGGGVAGLATAALLARDGHEVRLLERTERLGGRAGSDETRGFRFDTGPSWYLMPEVYDHFYSLFGTSAAEQLDLRPLDPVYEVLLGDSGAQSDERVMRTPVPVGRERVEALFERTESGAGHRLHEYLDSARGAAKLAERTFLYNPFTRVRSIATPEVLRELPRLLRLLRVPLSRHVEKRFAHPLLRKILEYPAIFLGTDPRRAPSLYHLMSAFDLDEGVVYPMGGFARVVETLEQLARSCGVEIITGAEVTDIVTERAGRRRAVRGVRWRDVTGVELEESADLVVSAADLHHTETKLLEPGDRSYSEAWWERRVSGPGAVLVMLGVTGRLPQLGHHSLLFTDDWEANFDAVFEGRGTLGRRTSLYVCKPSATDPGVAPEGDENLFVLVPVPADVELGAGGVDGSGDSRVEEIADRAVEQIARWAAIPDLAERVVVRRTIGPADFARDYRSWRGGMLGPAHTLGQSAMFRAQNSSRRVDGLYYAGATTAPGVGVPMCLISAQLVSKRIRGDNTPGPQPSGIGAVRASSLEKYRSGWRT